MAICRHFGYFERIINKKCYLNQKLRTSYLTLKMSKDRQSTSSRKFKITWLYEPWAQKWLVRNPSSTSLQEAFCTICKASLRAHKADLMKHCATETHKKASKAIIGNTKISSHFSTTKQINAEKEKDLF
ncbi:hypothetical protein ABEB36_013530 [Hypothenemus hampei]|uniref:Uncharacterized protein n=1 Tax=Hypothenemus hampei TaxID=57062 RepID=A0ABD1E4G4_HYPHA